LTYAVGRTFGLDSLLREPTKHPVEIINHERDMAKAGADIIATFGCFEEISQLQLWQLAPGYGEKVVDSAFLRWKLASLLEP
jgi:hypothetical protein